MLRETNENHLKWNDAAIESYEFTAVYNCFCPGNGRDIHVQVGPQTTDISYLDDGSAVEQWVIDHMFIGTFERLFESIQTTIVEDKPRRISTQFDSNLGYPTLVEIDYTWFQTDDRTEIRVSNFLDLSAAPE